MGMASPRTVTIVALSVALGLFFVFMGTIKLTPRLSKDAYHEMVSKYQLWWWWGDILPAGCPVMVGAWTRRTVGEVQKGGRKLPPNPLVFLCSRISLPIFHLQGSFGVPFFLRQAPLPSDEEGDKTGGL